MPGPMVGPRRGQTTEKAKDFKKTTKKLVKSYLAKYKIPIIIVIIFAIGSTIFTIVGPKILGNITTESIKNYQEIQILVGIICGLVESKMGIDIYKRANSVLETELEKE